MQVPHPYWPYPHYGAPPPPLSIREVILTAITVLLLCAVLVGAWAVALRLLATGRCTHRAADATEQCTVD